MDTKRHREISKVGEKILKPALKRAGREDMRIAAFYLGNWLTDVQQAVDPPVYANVLKNIDEVVRKIDEWFAQLKEHAPALFIGPLRDLALRAIERELRETRDKLVTRIRTAFERGGDIATGLHHAFRFIGYFKFVLASDGKSETKMDRKCYFDVFDNRYRQYFPHEHLDRPEVSKDKYDTAKASAPTNEWYRGGNRPRDLYAYLREDLRIAAGLLAYLDGGPPSLPANRFGWAAATFHAGRTTFTDMDGKQHPVSDADYEWNRHLSLLGHAMHAVEDYFAHSTFVEHASLAIPQSKSRLQRGESDYVLSYLGIGDVLARRLKAWQPVIGDWKQLPDDTHAVTGYFDFRDTVISLSHAVEELYDVKRESGGRAIDDLVEYEYKKLLNDTLELFGDPTRVWERNNPASAMYDENADNAAVKWLRDKGGHGLKLFDNREAGVNLAVQYLIHDGPLKDKPKEVQDSFREAVRLLGQGVGAALLGYDLYTLVKDIRLFVADPFAWLGKYLSKEVVKILKTYGKVYVRRGVAFIVGAYRIGCHSLISKDSGPELLHPWAMSCAKALHWYVLGTITRHSWPVEIAVARGSASAAHRNVVSGYRWIDWLELVEYFCDYPLTAVDVTGSRIVATTIQHVTRAGRNPGMSDDSLLKLAGEYGATYVPRGGVTSLTWQAIADANFPTEDMTEAQRKQQINKLLAARGEGTLVKDGRNYAFRPGIKVNIPNQRVLVPDASALDFKDRWWYAAIMEGDKTICSWIDSGRPGPKAPRGAHRWIMIDRARHGQLVSGAFRTRQQKEVAYNG